MNVFNRYAGFYDALYAEKDYAAEVDYLERLLSKYAGTPVSTILDLGCGTGGHALRLAERGYLVTGVDRSAEMLTLAQEKSRPGNPEYLRSDLVRLNLGREFDAVISMFAVMSYVTENQDLLSAFRRVRKHLRPGGIFFFDAWFGPAVLAERPTDRRKIVTSGSDRIIRFAHPELDVLSHTVTVEYKVVHASASELFEEAEESHRMRFFFPREVEQYLHSCGFRLLSMHPFLDDSRPLDEHDWNMAVVACRQG
jgi:SAM-dependent methyltransferase